MRHRPWTTSLLAAVVLLVTAACSSSGSAGPSPGGPRQASPAPGSSQTTGPSTSAPGAPSASAPGNQPRSGLVSASVKGLPASLAYGAAPAEFTVTVSNGTSVTYTNLGLLVSLHDCTCSSAPVPDAPEGTMQQQNPATGQWTSVYFDIEGGGMDYVDSPVVSGITLRPGATQTYTFRMAFKPLSAQIGMSATGTTGLDVNLEQLPVNLATGEPVFVGGDEDDPAATANLGVTNG
jgi:hypothetical protein